MRENKQDTPPSSIHGDEFLDEMEEGEEFYEVDEEELMNMINRDDDMEDGDQDDDTPMEPPEDHASLVFDKHTGSVFSCALHPNGNLAATGGEDDKAYIWSVDNGEIVMDCTGHSDSVIFVGFSFDGVYLATGDMNGLVKVWKCQNAEQKQPWELVFEYEMEELIWGMWHFGARVLICGTVSGHIYVFKVPSGDTKVLQGNNSKVECAKLFKDGVRLSAGYEDGTLKVWDLKTSAAVHQVPPTVHGSRVNAIDTHPENNLMASISPEGKVVLTTSANGRVVGELRAEDDLEAVEFAPEPLVGMFALGTLGGAVNIWDATRQTLRHHCARAADPDHAGVTKLLWVQHRLVAGCLDGSLRVYDGRSGQTIKVFTGHLSEVLDLCYGAERNIVLTSSDDGTARIFKFDVSGT